MKKIVVSMFAVVVATVACICSSEAAEGAKIRVLLTSGGHKFETDAFFAVFDAMSDVQYTKADIPKDLGLLKPGLEKQYDVLVRYDMAGKASAEEQQAFVELLRTGIGFVSLHHNIGAHRDWPEYTNIVGGQYVFKESVFDGKNYPKSTYAHDQELKITVADKSHPITQGVGEFTITDETYGGLYVSPRVHVLLKTDHPKNSPEIAWVTKYGKSPVAYLMLGHDGKAYGNPNFGRLVHNAIRWAAANK
jgi:type 1 glutamine amidotransferase